MARIGFIPEIIEVKEHLAKLQEEKILKTWELPYENLLTRRSAAIFFLTPHDKSSIEKISEELGQYKDFSYRENTEKTLSNMQYRITFNGDEKLKNEELLKPQEEEITKLTESKHKENGQMVTS